MKYKSLYLLFLCLLWPSVAVSQTTWRIVEGASSVDFRVQHFYLTHVDGHFRSFAGIVVAPDDSFADARISATIDVESIYTGLPMRDEDLMEPYFFDQKNYPVMLFESTSFEHVDDSTYTITGELSIRDVTKPIELHAVRHNEHLIRYGKRRVDFLATGSLNRFDYGLEWNKIAEFGHAIVGETVEIILKIVLIED